jgi:phosphatidate phosphatase APP1
MLVMKNLLILFVILFITHVHGAISIVSDLDDTIKITNSGREIDGTINAVFTKDVFTGMPEFFEAAKLYTNELHILSASPTVLRPLIQKTLKQHQLQYRSLILRNPLRRQEMYVYKLTELRRLLENSPDDFILIGDDVGKDPEVYDEIKRSYPDRILAIYIHVIKNREVPRSAIKYWTAFDLSLKEFMAGRMLKSWVDQSVQVLMDETKKKLIFPKFADCPKTPTVWAWQLRTSYARQSMALARHFNTYCISRWSDNLPIPPRLP